MPKLKTRNVCLREINRKVANIFFFGKDKNNFQNYFWKNYLTFIFLPNVKLCHLTGMGIPGEKVRQFEWFLNTLQKGRYIPNNRYPGDKITCTKFVVFEHPNTY